MKALIILLVLAKGVLATPDVIPQSVKEEMVSEEPQYREAFPLSPLLAVVVIHFPKAKLWVITKIHMMKKAFGEADKSSDWWRQIGAVVVRGRKIHEKA